MSSLWLGTTTVVCLQQHAGILSALCRLFCRRGALDECVLARGARAVCAQYERQMEHVWDQAGHVIYLSAHR